MNIVNDKEYIALLQQSGLRKRELGELLGVGFGSVYRWTTVCPGYVKAYLRLFLENRTLKLREKQNAEFRDLLGSLIFAPSQYSDNGNRSNGT